MAELQVGQRIGRYECLMPLARGGMASVSVARLVGAHGFQKLVAIKTIHAHLQGDEQHRSMLLDEAKLAARIEHPNVVRVHELGDEGGLLYLVMEYVEGEALQIAARHGFRVDDVPVSVVLRIVIDACRGLHAAHELRGEDGRSLDVVHRDVSPQNILVSTAGHTKIVDFGIAKASERVVDDTSTNIRKGKLPCMAPEQVQAGPIDRRADVWALGLVTYQLLTGKNPFKAETQAATIADILLKSVDPPSAGALNPLPPGLDDVVLKCLEKNRDERFATAAELADALERVASAAGLRVTTDEVASWLQRVCGPGIEERRLRLRDAAVRVTPPVEALVLGGSMTPVDGATAGARRPLAIGAAIVVALSVIAMLMTSGNRRADAVTSMSGTQATVSGATAAPTIATPSATVVEAASSTAPPSPSPALPSFTASQSPAQRRARPPVTKRTPRAASDDPLLRSGIQ